MRKVKSEYRIFESDCLEYREGFGRILLKWNEVLRIQLS
jgi:hypothetical protein